MSRPSYEARVLAWNDEHLEERFYTFAGMALSDGVSAWLADKRAFDRVVKLRNDASRVGAACS